MLVFRFGLLALVVQDPERGVIIDSHRYLELASLLGEGHYRHTAEQDLIWPPGYPGFLFLVSGFSDPQPLLVGAAQLAITGLASIVLYRIGVEAGSEAAGIIAALLNALSPNVGLWSLTVMSETLFGAILAVAALCWLLYARRDQWRWLILSGLALGAAAFVRPIGVPLILLWFVATLAWGARDQGFRVGLSRSVLLVAAAAMLIVPWAFRNWQVRGEFAFSKVGGKTLEGFNMAAVLASAEGITRDQAASVIGEVGGEFESELDVALRYPGEFARQQALGVMRSTLGVESGVWARLFGYGIERQGGFGVLTGLLRGNIGESLQTLWETLGDRATSVLMMLTVVAIAFTAILYILAAFGIAWARSQGGIALYLVALTAVTIVYLLVIPGAAGQSRFRIPAEPYLSMVAGFGAVKLGAIVKRRREKQQMVAENQTRA